MYLKSLEIQGFKSFPDKTLLQFGSDCTAIVGPNGSGKSNISDAISWVLGEQSTRALRGAKMEDVIFGGTAKRPAVGYAEATLVLDNSDASLRIETPEVMITRRYFRSGESEYYINKQLARLKDINELFMDTGLGREGYSNIGQGRIDEILALKSTDRREIFEEAAGISKFRHRKEDTERRLANTEDNLLRIGDKISELELQVGPLKEQAEKAQKYLTLRGELRGLEVTVWLENLKKIAETARKAETDYASAAFILEQAHDELTTLYSRSEQLSLQYNQQTLQLDHQRETIGQLETARQQTQNDITLLQSEIQHHRTNIARVQQELQDQQTRSGGIAGQIAAEQEKIAANDQELSEAEQALAQAQTQADALSGEAAAAGQKLTALHAQQALLQTQSAATQAQIASMEASMEEVQARKAVLEEDLTAARARKAQIADQQSACKKSLAQAQEDAQSAKNTIAGYELRLRTRQDKRDALQKQASAAGVQLDTLDSKIRMLQELERDYEGFSKAVRLVMQDAGAGRLRGVHGPVSKLIRVEDRYTTAIETALGAAMQNIVVSSEEDGKAAIQMLKRRDGGRATFLPLTTIRPQTLQDTACQRQPGFIAIASSLVSCDAQYRAVVENALGRTVICDTLDHAVPMARTSGSRVRIVTLDGQVMNAGGSMTGGSAAKSAGARLVVIGRPPEEEGLSLSKTISALCTRFGFAPKPEVFIAGIGPGSEALQTQEVRAAIRRADCLIGARRMLDAVAGPQQLTIDAIAPETIASHIAQHPECGVFCVVMSGDTGFYSGTKKLLPLLKECRVRVLPGLSSMSYLCARLGVSYEDAVPVSLHGRDLDIAREVRRRRKVFTLVGGDGGMQALCERLTQAGLGHVRIAVGERLSYPDEKITCGTAAELASREFDKLSVALIENPAPDAVVTHGLPDEVFLREMDPAHVVPMTKSEVRAVCLSKLALTERAVCWDVGAGTGSVSIEMALQAKRGRVYAVERQEDALALLARNKAAFSAGNLEIVSGTAPAACEALPAPTHVFLGGTAGNLNGILDAALRKNPHVRIVATAVTLESVGALAARMADFEKAECVSLQAARARTAGSYHLMQGQNPVYIFTMQNRREQA